MRAVVDAMKILSRAYGGRVVLAGRYNGYREQCLLYCRECDEFFRQRFESTYTAARTRCKCEYDKPVDTSGTRFKAKGIGRSYGHSLVQPWELPVSFEESAGIVAERIHTHLPAGQQPDGSWRQIG